MACIECGLTDITSGLMRIKRLPFVVCLIRSVEHMRGVLKPDVSERLQQGLRVEGDDLPVGRILLSRSTLMTADFPKPYSHSNSISKAGDVFAKLLELLQRLLKAA